MQYVNSGKFEGYYLPPPLVCDKNSNNNISRNSNNIDNNIYSDYSNEGKNDRNNSISKDGNDSIGYDNNSNNNHQEWLCIYRRCDSLETIGNKRKVEYNT